MKCVDSAFQPSVAERGARFHAYRVPSLFAQERIWKMDCTLEMRQPGWAHFAGKGLQSEAKAILTEVPADGC